MVISAVKPGGTVGDQQRNYKVEPQIRIVPTGVVTEDGKLTGLKLTAVILPKPNEDSTSDCYLETWPADILNRLRNQDQPWTMPINLFSTDQLKIGERFGRTLFAKFDRLPAAFDGEDGVEHINDICKAWIETFGEESESWSRLSEGLGAFGKSEKYRASDHLNEGAHRKSAIAIDEKEGFIKTDLDRGRNRRIDGIYAESHADLAVVFEYGRAARVRSQLSAEREEVLPSRNESGGREPLLPSLKSKNVAEAAKIEKDIEQELNKLKNERLKIQYEKLEDNFYRGQQAFSKARAVADDPAACVEASENPELEAPLGMVLNETTAAACLDKAVAAGEVMSAPQGLDDGQKNLDEILRNERRETQELERFFVVQSTGALARFFCLTFDLNIEDLGEIREALQSLDTRERFFFVGAGSLDGEATAMPAAERPATLTKIYIVSEGTDNGSQQPVNDATNVSGFWPATKEDLALHCMGKSDDRWQHVSQSDGYRIVQDLVCSDKSCVPRFDITSLDLRAGTEHEIMAQMDEQKFGGKLDAITLGEGKKRPQPAGAVFHTAGLAFLDRGIQFEKCRMLARRERYAENPDFSLFAEDLTVGYRLDVGVPLNKDETIWRPLQHRVVSYGTSGASEVSRIVNRLMPLVAGSFKSAERVNFDAVMIVSPERMVPAPGQQPSSDLPYDVDMAVAENYALWGGPPMGAEAGSRNMEDNGPIEDRLPFGRTISLPSDGDDAADIQSQLLPPLRFGRAYRFAQRVVYSGGRSVRFGSIERDNACNQGRLSFPCGISSKDRPAEARYFRFLRQKSVDGPVVLLPLAEAINEHRYDHRHGSEHHHIDVHRGRVMKHLHAHRNGGHTHAHEHDDRIVRWGPQDTHRVTVRTITDPQNRSIHHHQPAAAVRIIMPPQLALDDAARHGVFDRDTGKKPKGAFNEVLRKNSLALDDFEMGGNANTHFPVLKTQVVGGVNGELLETRPRRREQISSLPRLRQKRPGPSQVTQKDKQRLALDITEFGDDYTGGIYLRGRSDDGAKPYYPDPFAHTLVVRARYAGTRVPALEAPVSIAVNPAGLSESVTDLLRTKPVALQVLVTESEQPHAAVSKAGEMLDRDGRLGRGRGQKVPVVKLFVPRGVKLEVDMWFVPTVRDLTKQSSLIQSLAILEDLGELSQSVTEHREHSQFVGTGGFPVPTGKEVELCAKRVRTALLDHPIDDLVSVTTILAEHASNDINHSVGQETLSGFLFHRASYRDVIKHIGEQPEEAGGRVQRKELIVQGETAVIIDGTLDIDLRRANGFDIEVQCIDPAGDAFDRPQRTRALIDRRAGTWPYLRERDGKTYLKAAQQIFGFKLESNGRVGVDSVRALLFRVRNLPPVIEGAELLANGLTRIDLHELLYGINENQRTDSDLPPIALKQQFGDAVVSAVQSFSGTVGRKIDQLTIRPIPRAIDALTEPDYLVHDLNFYMTQIMAKPFPLSQLIGIATGTGMSVPSSQRPAEPAARGATYQFSWSGDAATTQKRRQASIRLYLDRPWGSSGFDERLGIVLWPPKQRIAYRREPLRKTGRPPRLKNFLGFEPGFRFDEDDFGSIDQDVYRFRDEDLGWAGRFISRLGSDPIKNAKRSPPPFLTAGDFEGFQDKLHKGEAGLDAMTGEGHAFELVENVLMPPPLEAAGGGQQRQDAGQTLEAVLQPFAVSVLTAKPHFDAERELWYVDVLMNSLVSSHEPMIRFGLVRYYENSDADLACSRPITVWAKLLPERTFSANIVEKIEPGTGQKQLRINARLAGGVTTSNIRVGSGLQERRPRAYCLLTHERVDEAGKVIDRRPVSIRSTNVGAAENTGLDFPVLTPKDEKWVAMNDAGPPANNQDNFKTFEWKAWISPDIRSDRSDVWREDESSWFLEAEIIDQELIMSMGASDRLVLHVEEVDQYRPAQYPGEPIDVHELEQPADGESYAANSYLVESGPRFAASLVLNGKDHTGERR